GGVLVN
nr:Chain A, GGVLVN peptide, amyloid forming segment [Homo sapiens]